MKIRSMFIGLILILAPAFSINGYSMEISAEMIIKQGDAVKKGKIYIKGEKQRIEAEGQGITIVRGDKNTAWTIIPEEKSYIDMPLGPDFGQKLDVGSKLKDEVSRKLIGEESIDGLKTKKYAVTVTSGSKTESIYQWVLAEMDFPIKMTEAGGRWSVEYKNIKKTVPDSLFELPSGYEKISIPLPPGFPGIPDDETPPPVPGKEPAKDNKAK
jgi:hypothetical protein